MDEPESMSRYQSKWTFNRRAPTKISDPAAAPGPLGVVQAFLNTAGSVHRAEELERPRDLGRFLSGSGLLATSAAPSAEDLRRAVALRDGLRALARANSGVAVCAEAVRGLEAAIGEARFRLHLDRDGALSFAGASEGVDGALETLCHTVAAAQLGGTWQRLKLCERGDCRRAYYDHSRSHSGRWCVARCGNKLRAETLRHRRRS